MEWVYLDSNALSHPGSQGQMERLCALKRDAQFAAQQKLVRAFTAGYPMVPMAPMAILWLL